MSSQIKEINQKFVINHLKICFHNHVKNKLIEINNICLYSNESKIYYFICRLFQQICLSKSVFNAHRSEHHQYVSRYYCINIRMI